MQIGLRSPTTDPNDSNSIDEELAMLIKNATKQDEIVALRLFKQIDPNNFNNIKLKSVLNGFLIDQPEEIDMAVIRNMWVYFRNTNPIGRSFGNLPTIDFSTDFIDDYEPIYEDFEEIFLEFLELDQGILYFRSNIYLTSQICLVKNFNKINTSVFTFGAGPGELEKWQAMINTVVLDRFNYQGPVFIYNLYEIRQIPQEMEDIESNF